jgi:AraC-like DNA-binding protein
MKQVHSMTRLEEMLNYLYQLNKGCINWVDVASKYDFSDQPHLIRHLKNSIGRTPAEYAQKRDLTIDIYGNFEFN